MADTITLSAVNKLTGEIFEVHVNPYDPDSLGNCLLDIKELAKELKNLEDDVKKIMYTLMEQNDFKPIQLKNGHDIVYKAPVTLSFDFNTVRKFIDEDMLLTYKDKKGSPLVKVQNGPLKELVASLVESRSIEDNAWKEIEKTAESKASTPYVQLQKV